MKKMHVIIDSREQDRIKSAKKYYMEQGLTVEVSELPIGDYIFVDGDKKAVFEYKTVSDFVASIQDNRVFNQVNALSEQYSNRFLVIHGTNSEKAKAIAMTRQFGQRVTLHSYISALARLSKYITIIQVSTPHIHECFYTMLEYSKKTFDEGELYHRYNRKNRNPALNFLSSIYGISAKKAKLIVDVYNLNTLEDLMTLTPEMLSRIKGIGKSTSEKIIRSIKK